LRPLGKKILLVPIYHQLTGMKKIFLSAVLILLIQLVSFGQSSETEPNNSYATANLIAPGVERTAILDGIDTVDYHKLYFPWYANFSVTIEATNTGSGAQSLQLRMYNTLRIGGEYVGNFYQTSFLVNQGATITQTITLCGKATDSFYLVFKSLAGFDYNFTWNSVNAYPNDGASNNTAATATPFFYNVEKLASVKYEFWGGVNFDTTDYFTSTLPAGNYNNIYLNINGQNNSCSGNNWLSYACYKNGNPVAFDSGYVGNNPSVNNYGLVASSIPLSNMQAGDVLLVKFKANAAFGYQFKYSIFDEFAPDVENNCCYYNAIPLSENIPKSGNVGTYDYNNEVHIDEYDTYKIILPNDGAFNLTVKARNDECTEWSYILTAEILDKYGNYLYDSDLISWDNYPACSIIKTDTIKFRAFFADTFYLRLHTNYSDYYGKVSYNIRYQRVDSTVSDANESYNNPVSTVLPIAEGVVKKGHVRFNKNITLVDALDLYKVTMPADGSITVYLKATYRGDYAGTNNNSNNRLAFITNGFTDYTPSNPPVTGFTPDAVYLDTFLVCGLGTGDIVFTLSSSGLPYEYEVRYQLTDTSSLDNDTEPNNSFAEATAVAGGVLKKGHINYIGPNVVTDTYDYYKFIYTKSDSLKIPMQATNTSCENSKNIRFRAYNKNQSQIATRLLANNSSVAAGQTVYDTLKLFITAPDTIYLRFEATDAFKYELSSNLRLPVITGDTTVCYGTEIYTATNVGNANSTYNWSLPAGGGSLMVNDSVATVTWNGSGSRSIELYTSNATGNSPIKTLPVSVDSVVTTQAPVISNFARTLTASSRPAGTYVQWYRNGSVIANATDTVYYAALAGSYTAKFINNCGTGPASNTYSFPADAISQTISFPHTPNQSMAPALKIVLPATASSGLPVYYTRISGPGTVIQDSLSITGVGTIIIKAMQPGDDIYSAATSKYDTIVVVKGNQVINFPPIPDQMYRVNKTIPINPTSSSGLNVAETIVSGFATVSGNIVRLTGAGNVTVRATQAGNANYNAATPVDRTFCIGIDTLSAIVGANTACLGTYTYTVQKIPGANYVWSLSGGGNMVTSNDTAFITWQTTGTHTLKVKANSSCNPMYSFEPQKNVTINNVTPTPVTNMFPVNNTQNQSLPLNLSWVPGDYTETYDLFVWDSTQAQPGVPYKANITGISYTIPQNAFAFNNAYKWRLVSKNPCNQVSGPIQTFRLVPLPDITVTSVSAPTTAISGQTITISWTVKNNGPGNTAAGSSWQDAVYLTFDTTTNFSLNPEVLPHVWSNSNFPLRALILGSPNNVTALQSGQQYSNSINFTIPISYNLPLYAYVITNKGYPGIVEVTKTNDTARSQNPINITLAPTPDLRVDSMFTPSSTFSGSTVNISYKVKNYGSLTPVGASWLDNAYLSQSILYDSATAFKLNAPKANGSYYPNALPAGVTVNTQLQHDSAYYRSFQAVIPNNIFGTWFLHVKTNNNGSLYEGSSFNNNTNNNAIQVYLSPTPKLTISSLNLPVTQASTTQPIGINWNIYNDGFRDNIEKNRGHYITMSTCAVPCGPGSPPNSICYGPSVIKDSIAFGSSYWLDRVYLSTDSTGLNLSNATLLKETTHGVQNSGVYTDPNPSYVSCPATVSGNVNVDHIIDPGSNFPANANFNIPSSLMPGTYYIYVWTNATKTVFEYPGTPEIKRTGALLIQRPDAVVSSISSPATAVAGQQIQIGYSITNNGPGAVYNHIRRDSIYISTSAVFNASAQLIGTNIFTEDLPVGTPVPHSFNYTLHPSQSGTRYFFVRTNIDSAFRETNYANNISVATTTIFTPAAPVDFVVTNVQASDTVVTVFISKINYAVTNTGTGTATGTWMDSLFVSCTNVYGQSTAYYIGRKQQTRTIAPGGNYTDSFSINIPFTYKINSCFTQFDFNNAYFFVKANANGAVYEGAAGNNNVSGSPLKVLDNPLVDHIVTTVNGSDSAWVGQPYNISWTVKNIGRNPIIDYESRWDSVYVSVDSVLNSNAVKTFRHKWTNKLEHNQTKTLNDGFNMVNVPTGTYYLFVKTNATNGIDAEKNYSNNVTLLRDANGAAKTIYITRPLLPDLTDSIISAPLEIALGQPATIIYRITNTGNAPTTGNFMHLIRLANDLAGNSNAAQLSFKAITTRLQPGQFLNDTVQVMIPTNITPRIYTLAAKADYYTNITELNEDNNTDINYMTVFLPDSSDLVVMHVTAPDTVTLGYKMDSARWVLKNNSGVITTGSSSDGIYLSQANELDSTATLIGIKTRVLNLPPLDTVKMSLAPMITGVTEGNYNMFVSTDLANQLPELDETNNAGISTGQVYVKVKELLLNVVENNTLFTDTRFYKLIIPDSLNGATISVKLTTADSLTRINQMFIGNGYIPTAAHFDYTYPTANYGNQEIVMAYTTAGTYYISIRTINPGNVTQNISLLARKLPFEISSVHTNAGGNIGNVTVKISGSLFTPGMTAKLNKPGTEIIASAVYFTNTTVVYATFNLQGKPLGIYDVTLSKADTAFAVLANGFSVVPANNGGLITGGGNNTGSGDGNQPGCDPGAASGLNSQLAIELLVPEYVMRAWPFVIQINYNNPTNFDVPAQVRTLFAEDIIKMAFTREGVNNGVHSLTMELTEAGGPPGIIRAGGSGTIFIYGNSNANVPAHTITLFRLQ